MLRGGPRAWKRGLSLLGWDQEKHKEIIVCTHNVYIRNKKLLRMEYDIYRQIVIARLVYSVAFLFKKWYIYFICVYEMKIFVNCFFLRLSILLQML